jgi:hypothetical protein
MYSFVGQEQPAAPGWQKPHSSPVKKHPNLWDMKTFFFFVVHGLSLAKQPPSGT